MISNEFELIFWVVLIAISFMVGTLVQQSKLDKAKILNLMLERDMVKLEDRTRKTIDDYKDKIDDLHNEIDRLHRKYEV